MDETRSADKMCQCTTEAAAANFFLYADCVDIA